MGDLFNTLNKSLPQRSSKALEGQLLCCYYVCAVTCTCNCVAERLSADVLVIFAIQIVAKCNSMDHMYVYV